VTDWLWESERVSEWASERASEWVSGHSFVYSSVNCDFIGTNTRQKQQKGFIPTYTVRTDFLVIQASTRAQNAPRSWRITRFPLVTVFQHTFCLYVQFYGLFFNIPQMSMSQLSTYSSSGFLFSYTHNTCCSIETTSLQFLVSTCSYIARIYNVPLVHVCFPSRTYGYVWFVCLFFEHLWTIFHFSMCEVQGSGIYGVFQWVAWFLNLNVSKERTSFIFDCEEVLESLKMEDRIWKLLINSLLLLFERQTKYPIFNNLFHVRLP
jgi:hypothetical protein